MGCSERKARGELGEAGRGLSGLYREDDGKPLKGEGDVGVGDRHELTCVLEGTKLNPSMPDISVACLQLSSWVPLGLTPNTRQL